MSDMLSWATFCLTFSLNPKWTLKCKITSGMFRYIFYRDLSLIPDWLTLNELLIKIMRGAWNTCFCQHFSWLGDCWILRLFWLEIQNLIFGILNKLGTQNLLGLICDICLFFQNFTFILLFDTLYEPWIHSV